MTMNNADSEGEGSHWVNDIHQGDAVDVLQNMPESSVHMAMCSPPYYGLRDYGVDGQIGLEGSLEAYIESIVAVADELQRVLRDDGSWWLNLGDSYATNPSGSGGFSNSEEYESASGHSAGILPKFGRKNKRLVPHRVAISLQDAGWIVRNDVTWYKPNPMPQSVKDRLNTCTEQIFHLVQEPDYWYDLDAIREPHSEWTQNAAEKGWTNGEIDKDRPGGHSRGDIHDPNVPRGDTLNPNGKNPGDVFEVTTKPFPDAHFAVYPPELCEKPIKATCPPKVCVECGVGYLRKTEKTGEFVTTERGSGRSVPEGTQHGQNAPENKVGTQTREFEGWEKPCDCDTDATEPGIALDPFAGAGTTCLVAKRLGRRFMGIELNKEYVAMAQKRVGVTVDHPELLLDDDETSLRAYTDGSGV